MTPISGRERLFHLDRFCVRCGPGCDQQPLELTSKVFSQALEVAVAGDNPLLWVLGEQRSSESVACVDHDHLAPGEEGIDVVVELLPGQNSAWGTVGRAPWNQAECGTECHVLALDLGAAWVDIISRPARGVERAKDDQGDAKGTLHEGVQPAPDYHLSRRKAEQHSGVNGGGGV